MNTTQVALVAVIASVVGPLLLAGLTNRQRRAERLADYKRQDDLAIKTAEVADQAVKAAKLLLESNEEVRIVAQRTSSETMARLDQIHTLVNSELTEAERRARDATVATLAALREVVAIKAHHGIDPSPETMAVMAEIESRIDVMSASLARKQAKDKQANEERTAADEAAEQ